MDDVEQLVHALCQLDSHHIITFLKRDIAYRGRPYLHDSRAIIGNRLPAILVHHQQVTTVGAQRRLDGGLDRKTGIDVGDDLAFALGGVGSCSPTFVSDRVSVASLDGGQRWAATVG